MPISLLKAGSYSWRLKEINKPYEGRRILWTDFLACLTRILDPHKTGTDTHTMSS